MTRGFLYVCADDDYIDEARESASSVKNVMPEAELVIVTDAAQPGEIFDQVLQLKNPQYGFRDKVENLQESPFDRTVFLDTDTYLTDAVPELFDILDTADMAVAHDSGRNYFDASLDIPRAFPEFNTGVMSYRMTDTTQELLNQWRTVYESHVEDGVTADQPAFRQAAYELSANIYVLPPEYNCRTVKAGYLNGRAKILHGRHDRDMEAIAAKINDTTERRVFASLGSDIGVFSQPKATLFHWLWFSLAGNDLLETINIVKRRVTDYLTD